MAETLPIAPESVTAELERVLASRTFAPSARHRDLLKFIVESHQSDPGAELKEASLAVDVLGRDPATFDPRIDTIVRVEARRLRARLDEYYAGEGFGSVVRISVPRGSYSPVFTTIDDASTPRPAAELAQPTATPATGTPTPAIDDAPAIASPAATRRPWRHWITAATLFLAVGGAVAMTWRGLETIPVNAARPASLAVLPFANLSGDASLDPFIDGLVDEITGALAREPGLRVTARTSAFAFKGQNQDIRDIGRKLGVTSVVEGSVQRSEGHLKIIVQLNRADDGSHLWSNVFVTPLEEIFQLQTKITQAVADTLQPAIRAQVTRPSSGTASWPAWQAYSRAQFVMRNVQRESFVEAIPLLDEAIRLDPRFAGAYASRGVARLYANAWAGTSEPAANQRIRDDIDEAIRLDPGLAGFLSTLAALVYLQEYDWPKARSLYERALAGASTAPDVHAAYAGGLMLQGRAAEAEAEYQRALSADPLNFMASLHLALVPFMSGRPDAAVERLSQIASGTQANPTALDYLVRARLLSGDIAGARIDADRLKRETGSAPWQYLALDALITFTEGKPREARAAVERLANQWGAQQPYLVANAYAWIGDAPNALRWFLRAVEKRDSLVAYMPVDPMMDPIRRSPEFRKAWDAIPGLTASMSFPDPR